MNLKLKSDKQNIWFGNITAGSGVASENRWKESLNLGLLKKVIKVFYLADYNNLGEKSTEQIAESAIEMSTFGEDRIERKAKNHFIINSNENSSFSKSQSDFNKALFNSLSFTKKLQPNLTLRGVGYFANDNQIQDSYSETVFNIQPLSIFNTEISTYKSRKILASGEIELKYFANEKNYFTNIFIYKNNGIRINSNLLFNENQINQFSKDNNETFYNHLNHTYKISDNKILTNYFYFGNDKINQKSRVISPFLNEFLDVEPISKISQNTSNTVRYFGVKSKLISTFKKLEHMISLNLETSTEKLDTDFLINLDQKNEYSNVTDLNEKTVSLENGIRYNFTQHFDFSASLNFIQNNFENNSIFYDQLIANPRISLNIKRYKLGNASVSYSENSRLPEINYFTNSFQLMDYRTFRKAADFSGVIKNKIFSFSHSYYNDPKRFSLNTNFLYINQVKTFNTNTILNENFDFTTYLLANGGESYNGSFSIVNYFRSLKIATKLETKQNWSFNPIKVNDASFSQAKNYISSYKFSATTYFSLPINLDFEFNYNYFQSKFSGISSENNTQDAFINANYTISKHWLAEINSTFYQINNQNYSFINAVINYTPDQSRFSYRLSLNNLMNENEFSVVSVNDYTAYKSTINLVPRYLLFTVKYRF